jgi:hypothetical protein
MRKLRTCAVLAGAAAAACSPALDWREVRTDDGAVQAMLPCRPDRQVRTVVLAGQSVRLALAACGAGGQTWGIASADVGDPARVTEALDELRRTAAANLGASGGRPLALEVRGATPNARSARFALAGRLPDGAAVEEQFAVFAFGTRVFQATVLGAQLPADGVETFFGSLRAGAGP